MAGYVVAEKIKVEIFLFLVRRADAVDLVRSFCNRMVVGMNINELIEQIGGRERLAKLIAQYEEDGYCDVKDDEVIAALRALLAVLDAKPVGEAITPSLASVDNLDVGTKLYAAPQAASAPDGLAAAVNRLLDSDGSRGTFSAIRRGNALAEVESLLASAPTPGGNGE